MRFPEQWFRICILESKGMVLKETEAGLASRQHILLPERSHSLESQVG